MGRETERKTKSRKKKKKRVGRKTKEREEEEKKEMTALGGLGGLEKEENMTYSTASSLKGLLTFYAYIFSLSLVSILGSRLGLNFQDGIIISFSFPTLLFLFFLIIYLFF